MAQESTSSEKKVYLQCKNLIDDGVADDDLFVIFISNEAKKIPVWNRIASNSRDGRVVRDYHVFCIQRIKDGESGESEYLVWDLDSKSSVPSTLSSYISESIRSSSYKLFAEFQRVFSVVHAPVFLYDFASDWTHMKVSKENWTSPPESEVRVAEAFSEHFTKEGMIPLVEYNAKKIFEVKVKEMKTAITTKISEKAEISEVTKIAEQHIKKNDKLPEIGVVGILWDVLMDAVRWSWKNQQGKDQQKIGDLVLHQVKTWAKLLKQFCTTGELQLELLYNVQVECYEATKLMNLFPEIVRNLYNEDVLAENTIYHWFRKGTKQEGRESFVKALEPFVKKIFEEKIKNAITTQKSEETEISKVIETVKQHVKDAKLPEIVVVRILWDVLMDAFQCSGKNQELALRQVKTWAKLLIPFCTTGKLELELLYKVQVWCNKDTKRMKLFPQIVEILYHKDVLAEDTILHWFREGTNQEGRESFVKALELFVKWLEEAEEEE